MIKPYLTLGLALALAAPLTAHAHPEHDDDRRDKGPDVTKTFDFDDFDALNVSGVYEFDVQAGKDYSITLTGPEYEMENIEVTQKGGVLRLGTKHKNRKRTHRDGVEAVITMPKLNDVNVSGVATGEFSGIDADSLELHISGVAEVEIEGRCGQLEAHVSGVGELDAKDLVCEDVEVHLSGVGEVNVHATEYADISAGGVGEVNVYGDPEDVDKSKSWFTQVNIK